MKLKNFWKKNNNSNIDPDEIFLDSSNIPQFDRSQFEGRMEKPFSKTVPLLVIIFFIGLTGFYLWKAWSLQIVNGQEFANRSVNNSLRHTTIFSERGSITDRNGDILVTNVPNNEEEGEFSFRRYTEKEGMSHILGYVKYPKKDKYGFYFQEEFVGVDGIEKEYDSYLTGENGLKIIETNAVGEIASESVIEKPVNGKNLKLSIDSDLQDAMYNYIKDLSSDVGFGGGSGVIMDVNTGKILTMANFPEYKSQVLTDGNKIEEINSYANDPRNVYLNRAVSGLYTPGSIIKLFVSVGILEENIINPNDKILSTGSISVPNPYFPDLATVFNDWKAHGLVNLRDAIAVSSNVYYYVVGGGFKDQVGLGIEKINEYVRKFGFGDRTGIGLPNEAAGTVPNPEWKEEVFPGDPWRVGDTYYTAIGQYGFQVTPLQAVRAVSAIANNGKLFTPSLILDEKESFTQLDLDNDSLKIVQEGMRQAVTDGTAKNLLNMPVSVAAKTGTAEIGVTKNNVNSWIVGYFPYENPKYAFAVMMERGDRHNTVGGLYVMTRIFDWINRNAPEYLR